MLAQPKASKSEVVGEVPDGDSHRLKIKIHALPADGEANEELLRFLKKLLRPIKPSSVSLIRGEQSRQKDVLVGGVTCAALESCLQALIDP